VSVGTLYQYFPDKHALLYAALENYLTRVLDQFERACELSHGQRLLTMVECAVMAYVEAKTGNRPASTAILELSWNFRIAELVSKLRNRTHEAFAKMLRTASDVRLRDPDLAVTLIHSAMHSAARAMIEAGSGSPKGSDPPRRPDPHVSWLCPRSPKTESPPTDDPARRLSSVQR